MNSIKLRAWRNDLKQFFYVGDSFSISLHDTGNKITMWSSDGVVDEFPAHSVMSSTGLTDNDKNDIYYGDIYRVYGYGDLAIKNIHDVMTVIEAMGEGDLGDKLGDIYNNPELKDAE